MMTTKDTGIKYCEVCGCLRGSMPDDCGQCATDHMLLLQADYETEQIAGDET